MFLSTQLHPNAFKGGRMPGQMWPKNIGQITWMEWGAIFAGSTFVLWPATMFHLRWYQLNESSWIDNNYDMYCPYERTWVEKNLPNRTNQNFRTAVYNW